MNDKKIPAREVFLSSTTSDLAPYRRVAQKVIDALNFEFSGRYSLTSSSMFSEPQSGERETAVEVSQRWVAKADWLVLIVAWNYGFVPDGAQCSVTEREYREATQKANPPKKCFVFIAGGDKEGDGDLTYFPIKGKEANLMTFKGRSAHENELAAFKDTLRSGPYRLFTDIENFRELLTLTLKRKIEKDLLPEPTPDLTAILLFTGLLTPVRDCISSVKTLADLKRLHDRLHKIRQFGIRRWREVVLMRWQGDDKAPAEAMAIYFEGLAYVNGLIGEIRSLFDSLGQDLQNSLVSIPRVLDHFSNYRNQIPDRRTDFENSTDLLAGRVQAAFTACDWQMRLMATQLGSQFQQFASKGMVALNSDRLNSDERVLLRVEIEQTQCLHEHLQRVLEQHNAWQRVHDGLQVVDDNRHRESFAMAIAPVIDARQETSELVAAAANVDDDEARRATLSGLIDTVRRNLDLLATKLDENTYDAMRKAFDDLFFEVDAETLKAVEKTEARATLLERNLRAKELELEDVWRKGR